jgi:hypothetical protein
LLDHQLSKREENNVDPAGWDMYGASDEAPVVSKREENNVDPAGWDMYGASDEAPVVS